jgi:hypothetical protein
MKRKMPQSGTLNINAIYNNGQADQGISYSVPADQQDVVTVDPNTGIVTSGTKLGTATVTIKESATQQVIGNVTIRVVSADEWALESLDHALVAGESTTEDALSGGPVLITKNDGNWVQETLNGNTTAFSNTTSNGKQYIYRTGIGQVGGANELSYLVDGDQSTVHSVGGGSQFGWGYAFEIQFEQNKRPSRIEIDFAAGTFSTGHATFTIHGKTGVLGTTNPGDGQLFHSYKELTEGTTVINLPDFMDFRRLEVSLGGSNGVAIIIKEVRVYEESTAPNTMPLISPNSSAANWSLANGVATVVESGLTHKAVLHDNHLIQFWGGAANGAIPVFDADPATFLGVTREYGYLGGGVGGVINVLPIAKKPEKFEIDVQQVIDPWNNRNIQSRSYRLVLYGVLDTDAAANAPDDTGTWKFLGSIEQGLLEGSSSLRMSYNGQYIQGDGRDNPPLVDGLYKKLKVSLVPYNANESGSILISAIRWY